MLVTCARMRRSAGVKSVFLILLISCNFEWTTSKVYTRCGLAKALSDNGFPRTFIGQWVCLVESESAKDTSKVINKANGSKGLGLFQINSKDWCNYGKAGGECKMKCEDLINDDIRDDSICARRVQEKLGFRGWDGWMRSCYQRTLPIPNC